ncbi:MAG TPA: ferredoxin, partial [Acidimicrobiia bacterium]
YALAPDLFEVDDLGFAFERNDGNVPPALEDQARAAVANCPEFAISITESA